MAEYIEREKLRKTLKEEMQILKETPCKDDWDKGLMQGIKESIMHLNVAPSASVVEVVRCGKCRLGTPSCLPGMIHCANNNMEHRPDCYCSYGEMSKYSL